MNNIILNALLGITLITDAIVNIAEERSRNEKPKWADKIVKFASGILIIIVGVYELL